MSGLSFLTMAVTEAEANAYALARGYTAWGAASTGKTEALRRGQDYIAGEYNGRWITGYITEGVSLRYLGPWDDTNAPDEVKYAIVEAAIRELAVPFCLSPDITLGTAKTLIAIEGLQWKPVGNGSAASYKPILTSVDLLLGKIVTSAGTTYLERA